MRSIELTVRVSYFPMKNKKKLHLQDFGIFFSYTGKSSKVDLCQTINYILPPPPEDWFLIKKEWTALRQGTWGITLIPSFLWENSWPVDLQIILHQNILYALVLDRARFKVIQSHEIWCQLVYFWCPSHEPENAFRRWMCRCMCFR